MDYLAGNVQLVIAIFDKKETTKEEKKTLKVENHNLAQQVSPQA